MGSRSASSFSVDMFVQTLVRSTVLHDAATQLPLSEFFIVCIYSNSPLDRQNPVRQSLPSMQGSHALPQPPPGLEQPAPLPELAASSHLLTTHGAYVNSFPSSRLSVPPSGNTLYAQLPAPKEVPVPPLREPITLLAPIFVQTQASSPNHGQWFLPWSVLGNPSPTDLAPLPQLTVISCTINSDFPSLSGIQARRAEILPTSSLPPVVGFIQLSFRKPVTMSRTSPINSWCTPTTWTSLSCSTRTPLSQTLQFSHSRPTPRAKVRGAWYYSSFEACSAASLFLAHLQSLFARYTNIHNVVAKKRDASTELLQFLHAKMLEHNVDFIGGDFNMSAFSTVSDVFSDPEFSAPGHSCLWGLGASDEQRRECTGFLIMPKRPYEWRVDSHGCYKLDNSALGLGPRDQSAHLPVFLHLRNTNLPGPSSIVRSEQAQQRRYDRKHNKTERAKKRRP